MFRPWYGADVRECYTVTPPQDVSPWKSCPWDVCEKTDRKRSPALPGLAQPSTSTELISRTSGNSCIYPRPFSTNPVSKKATCTFSRKQRWCKSHIPEGDSKQNVQMTASREHTKLKALQREANHTAQEQAVQQRPVLEYHR